MAQALSDITVLDLSMFLPGPFCSMILADFGARVIKIERPGSGDPMRDFLPRYPSYSGNFSILNRNKESMTLNLKSDEGRSVFMRLIEKSDILIESFRPGVMDRLDLRYKDVSKVNKRMIYCSISGFGQDGPYRNVAGHDINYIAMNGILDLSGKKGESPVLPGAFIADIGGGAYPALTGILLALLARYTTGKGQFIGISMFDCSFLWLYYAAGTYFTSGDIASRGMELVNGGSPRYQIYATKDDHYLAVGALEDHFWYNLCDLLHIDDPRIRSNDRENTELAIEVLSEKFRRKTALEWLNDFEKADVCCSLIRNFREAISDPHFQLNGLIQNVMGQDGSPQKVLGNPIKLSETSAKIRSSAPLLGQNNDEILTSLGYSGVELQELYKKGII